MTETEMIVKREFYIDGTWVAPAAPRDLDVIDPSTEEACAVISLGDRADTDAAVAAAKRAFATWSMTAPAERLRFVEKILEVYQRRAEDMARAISLEMGAPIDLSRAEPGGAGTWHISNFITAFKEFDFVRPLGPHAPNDRIAMEPSASSA
jgi:aldehyde dehydrogenase (NAD+)